MAFNRKSIEIQKATESNAKKGPTGAARTTVLVLCLVECLVFGGSIFGWSVLVFTLKADGIYKDACPAIEANKTKMTSDTLRHAGIFSYESDLSNGRTNGGSQFENSNDIDCEARSAHFSLSFTIATVLMGFGALPFGWLFDKMGLMFTRFMATLLAIPGFLMLALVTPETSPVIYPAASMIALVAFIIMVTNFHVASLAGPKTSTVLSLYSGAVSTSGMMFLFVKMANDNGVERRTCLLFLTFLWSIVLLTTIALLPRYKIGGRPTMLFNLDFGTYTSTTTFNVFNMAIIKESDSSQSSKDTIEIPSIAGSITTTPNSEGPRFRDSALSLVFIFHLYFFAVNHFRALYFIGTFSQWAYETTNNDTAKVSQLTDLYGFANAITFIIAPIVGMIIDKQKKSLNAAGIKGIYRGIADVIPLFLTSIFQILFSVSVLLASVWSEMSYVSICLAHVTRGFLYASAFTFIGLVFPAGHLGKLIGLTYLIGGAANFLQYAFLSWANATGSQFQPNVAHLILAVSTLVHPVSILWRHRRIRK